MHKSCIGCGAEVSTTIKDIADKAGVSTSTVSRVLNDRPGLSPQTRVRVLQVAQGLNYSPSAAAATGSPHTLPLQNAQPGNASAMRSPAGCPDLAT